MQGACGIVLVFACDDCAALHIGSALFVALSDVGVFA